MDDLDLTELKEMFLEECRENVDVLEAGLLELGRGDAPEDKLNEVFRAAHSIKGGAATFGFMPLSELTHHMETLLDEMRSGNRAVNDADLELLLQSVDIVRDMIEPGADDGHPERSAMEQKLSKAVDAGAPAAPESEAAPEDDAQPAGSGEWEINFIPRQRSAIAGARSRAPRGHLRRAKT